ncbi:methyl-accepting chemotaxis protein [Rubrivivax sp. JA1055]|uniref:methyl-accepting chemotaxis protein n=1 Tax=Rubrivivax sp. JA1055 TaxID=2894194 RepID=UPI001E3573AD|nr:methyl-accepting chemotaxis protein [Rubrivivax sp. JA1055]MCC9598749.1 methyl-accepting chemotaxis protein [Rubrivivax sp. JA1055]
MIERITLSQRLALAFTLLPAAMLVLALLSAHDLTRATERLRGYVAGAEARAALAADMHIAVEQRAIAARNMLLLDDAADIAREGTAAREAHEQVARILDDLKRHVHDDADTSDEARRLVARIEDVERRYAPVALQVVALAAQGRRDEARLMMNRDCRPLLGELAQAAHDYDDLAKRQSADAVASALAEAEGQRLVLVGFSTLALIGAAVAGIALRRSIVRPLAQAVGVAEAVADGDLTHHIEARGRDEIAALMRALATMSDKLQHVVRQVRDGSDSIAVGTREIAVGSADISARTETQASALQQTAATMDQLGSTVRHNADRAGQADQLAARACTIAGRGGEAMQQVVHTMGEIEERSRRVLDIVGVIDGIAHQTRLLALNAAVEAARAGDHGRGFAVVAGEVRTLAQRSAVAAQEIKALVTDSAARVEQGSGRVRDAGQTLQELTDAIRHVGTIVAEIRSGSEEQASGVHQVGEAMAQIDSATQNNAALVEESAAATERLRDQAARLAQLVSVFRVAGTPA